MKESHTQAPGFFGAYPRTRRLGVAARLVRGIRAAIVVVAGWGFSALALTAASLFALLTFRIGAAAYFHHVAGMCARVILKIQGVRVELVNPERFTGRKARLVLMNHSSQLDLFIMSAVLPSYGTTLAKKQVYYIPFFGLMFYAFAIPTIDRKHLSKAIESLKKVAQLIVRRRATVCIAPEGTRSRNGKLGPFKKGPFHLAAHLDVPVVIAVIKGAHECLPMGRWAANPGVVRVEMVAEIPGDRFTVDNIEEMRDEVRAIYLRELSEE